jgi:hypothetical protein
MTEEEVKAIIKNLILSNYNDVDEAKILVMDALNKNNLNGPYLDYIESLIEIACDLALDLSLASYKYYE